MDCDCSHLNGPPTDDALPEADARLLAQIRAGDALLAAQRIDPQVTEAQITPTEVALTLTYRLGGSKARFTPLVVRADLHSVLATLPRPVAP